VTKACTYFGSLYREERVIGAVARVLGQVVPGALFDSGAPGAHLRGNLARKQATPTRSKIQRARMYESQYSGLRSGVSAGGGNGLFLSTRAGRAPSACPPLAVDDYTELISDKGITTGKSQLPPAPGAAKSNPDQPAATGDPNQNRSP
jgi:hypothetical protein